MKNRSISFPFLPVLQLALLFAPAKLKLIAALEAPQNQELGEVSSTPCSRGTCHPERQPPTSDLPPKPQKMRQTTL